MLDALDLHLHLHPASARLRWIVRDAQLKQALAPRMQSGVVAERHRARNWLVRFENAEWNAVETHT